MTLPNQHAPVERLASGVQTGAVNSAGTKPEGIMPSDCCGPGRCCVGACLPFGLGCAGVCVPNIGQC
jgi:hypothetical protein